MTLSKEQQDDVPQCDPRVVAYIREAASRLVRWPAPLEDHTVEIANALGQLAEDLESGRWLEPDAGLVVTYEEDL